MSHRGMSYGPAEARHTKSRRMGPTRMREHRTKRAWETESLPPVSGETIAQVRARVLATNAQHLTGDGDRS